MSLTEKLVDKIKVKVTKLLPDGRKKLCGEDVQSDGKGKEYFIVPGHQAAYLKTMFHGQYVIGEEFIPKEEEIAEEDKKGPGRPKGS